MNSFNSLHIIVEPPVAHHIPNAVLDGDFEYLEQIIYNHRDMVDYIGPAGFAAMHVAAYKKDMDMVDMLLKYGADRSLLAANGDSCAHIACRIGDPEIFDYFVEFCEDIDLKNKAGETMQDICEKTPTESDAYADIYFFFKWCNEDTGAHDVLRSRLVKNRGIIRDKIIQYREERIVRRRAHLVRTFIKDADDRKLGMQVYRHAGGADERRYYMVLPTPGLFDVEPWREGDADYFASNKEDLMKGLNRAFAQEFVGRSTVTASKLISTTHPDFKLDERR